MNYILHWGAMLLVLAIISNCLALNHVPVDVWGDYVLKHDKDYSNNQIAEGLAQYYYAYNKRLIDNHNAQYRSGRTSFELGVNQFSDMRLVQFNALFPKVTYPGKPDAWPAPELPEPSPEYIPEETFGYMFEVEDQGTKCNSGWAYATAKAVEIMQAQQNSDMNPQPLSAQNLIDCAGGAKACKNQVPQVALDYLAKHDMDLYPQIEYYNNKTQSEPGMCLPKGTMPTNLAEYSTITNGDDDELRRAVSVGFPVIVEVNPHSFEFMHYSKGIYEPPANTRTTGSHFMLVIGFGKDKTTNQDYWLLQNSFGTDWGENGLMRMIRSDKVKLAKNAIYPTKLGAGTGAVEDPGAGPVEGAPARGRW
ncbi:cathepsin L-like [Haematobia irritans]|uniref:cathepsin L-like n=1 Tax=Haematobia irritans TaxID=7368 RepID=UPI003F500E27